MYETKLKITKHGLIFLILLLGLSFSLNAQAPLPPVPVEFMAGHQNMYYQAVIKRPFSPSSKFNFFGLATYTANYEGERERNRMIAITQLSYNLGKGFGLMAGTDINSFSGFSPIVGPQHNFANRKILAVTVASLFLNEDKDIKLFGLYEYKPPINDKWTFYSRFQFIYNHSLREGTHNKSYIYLRAGLKRKALIFGLGANWDWSGPSKFYQDNYGPFVRWEFR